MVRKTTKFNPRDWVEYLLSIDFIVPFFLFIGVFLIYLHHLSPSIYGYDSGDFATAIIAKGIPHPSGYPLYTMLGILFNLLPFQTVAWKIGLVSAITSSLSVVFAYLITHELLKNRIISIFSGLSISFFYPFWLYAEVIEVLSLNTFFVLLLVLLAVKFHKTKKMIFLYFLSFSVGLSLTNNQVIILLFPGIFILLLINWKNILRFSVIFKSILLFLTGFLPYIYIPIAASFNPAINNLGAVNFENFKNLILRKQYGWGIGSTVPFDFNLLNIYFSALTKDLRLAPSIIAIIGIIYLIKKREWGIMAFLVSSFIFTGPFFFLYARTPLAGYFQVGQLERFIISSSVILILLMGTGVYFIALTMDKLLMSALKKINSRSAIKSLLTFILLIFFLYPFRLFTSHFSSTDFHNIRMGDNLAKDILSQLPKDTILILHSDTALFNTMYIQLAEKMREDIFIPTDYTLSKNYTDKQKEFYTTMRSLIKKNRALEKDNASLLLFIFNSRKSKNPAFYLYPQKYDIKKYKEIRFIPYGLLFKLADDSDLKLSKEEYEKKQNELLSKTHAEDMIRYRNLIRTNYNFIYISSIYSEAYLNIANYLLYYYKYPEKAKIYMEKANELNPTLQ